MTDAALQWVQQEQGSSAGQRAEDGEETVDARRVRL